jgi:hypothetical protein
LGSQRLHDLRSHAIGDALLDRGRDVFDVDPTLSESLGHALEQLAAELFAKSGTDALAQGLVDAVSKLVVHAVAHGFGDAALEDEVADLRAQPLARFARQGVAQLGTDALAQVLGDALFQSFGNTVAQLVGDAIGIHPVTAAHAPLDPLDHFGPQLVANGRFDALAHRFLHLFVQGVAHDPLAHRLRDLERLGPSSAAPELHLHPAASLASQRLAKLGSDALADGVGYALSDCFDDLLSNCLRDPALDVV